MYLFIHQPPTISLCCNDHQRKTSWNCTKVLAHNRPPPVLVPAPSLKRWYKSRNQYLIMFDISPCAGVITPTRSKYFTCYNNFIVRSPVPASPAYSICNYPLLCEMSLMITDIIGIIYTIRDVCEHFMRQCLPMFIGQTLYTLWAKMMKGCVRWYIRDRCGSAIGVRRVKGTKSWNI